MELFSASLNGTIRHWTFVPDWIVLWYRLDFLLFLLTRSGKEVPVQTIPDSGEELQFSKLSARVPWSLQAGHNTRLIGPSLPVSRYVFGIYLAVYLSLIFIPLAGREGNHCRFLRRYAASDSPRAWCCVSSWAHCAAKSPRIRNDERGERNKQWDKHKNMLTINVRLIPFKDLLYLLIAIITCIDMKTK